MAKFVNVFVSDFSYIRLRNIVVTTYRECPIIGQPIIGDADYQRRYSDPRNKKLRKLKNYKCGLVRSVRSLRAQLSLSLLQCQYSRFCTAWHGIVVKINVDGGAH